MKDRATLGAERCTNLSRPAWIPPNPLDLNSPWGMLRGEPGAGAPVIL